MNDQRVLLDVPAPPKKSWFSWHSAPSIQRLAQKEVALADLHTTLNLKEENLRKKNAQLSMKEKTLEQLGNQRDTILEELSTLKEKLESMKKEYESLQQERVALVKDIIEKQQELTSAQKILQQTASRITVQEQELDERDRNLSTKEETLKWKEQELLKKEGMLGSEQEKFSEREKENLHKELELMDRQKSCEDALVHLNKVHAEVLREKNEFEQAYHESFQSWANAHKDLHEITERARKEREAAQSIVSRDLALLQEREDELNKSIAELLNDGKKLEEEERSIVAKSRVLLARQKKGEGHESAIQKREREVKQREAFLDASLKTLERVKRELERKQEKIGSIKNIEATITKLKKTQEDFEDELAAEAEELVTDKEENENPELKTLDGVTATIRELIEQKEFGQAREELKHIRHIEREATSDERSTIVARLKELTTEIKLAELEG